MSDEPKYPKSESYDVFLRNNYCPWCDERYDKPGTSHALGCPDPKPPEQWGKQAQELARFHELVLYNDHPVWDDNDLTD